MREGQPASTCADRCEESEFKTVDALINQALMGAAAMIGTVALARRRARKLLVYVPGLIFLFTYWRKHVCATCQYYGRPCSTMLGVITARMMPRNEETELDRATMVVDLGMLGALMLLPLRQALSSPTLAVAYLSTVATSLWRIVTGSCAVCGNSFCPLKDVSMALSRYRSA